MKTLRLLLSVALCSSLFAADDKKEEKPPLPTEVKLTNGATLRRVSVVRWQKDTVVLKHVGGVDPIRYVNIAPEQRLIFEAHRAEGLAADEAKKGAVRKEVNARQAADSALAANKQRIRDAIAAKTLVVGMTREEAIESWGKPGKVNSSGGAYGSREQWIYERNYVYFDGGILASWQSR